MRPINKIILHCSDTPDGRDVHASDINEWHIQQGWSQIGYHFVITTKGHIERGRPDDMIGSHTKGMNSGSLGICWIGRDLINFSQYASLISLLVYLKKKYKIKGDDIYGHHEFNPGKTCPNLDMNQVREDVLNASAGQSI